MVFRRAAFNGIDRGIFLPKLGDYGISMMDLTEDEFLSDLENA